MYRQKQNEPCENKQEQEIGLNLDILEEYYSGGIAAVPGDEHYFQIKVADYAIKSLDDRGIQRVLRDVDNRALSLAMKGLSGEVRHRIFDNLSRRLAVMIAEDMEFMGPVRMRDVAGAIMKMATDILAPSWSTLEGRLSVVNGKELMSLVNSWLKSQHKVKSSRDKLIKALTPDDISQEIKDVINLLTK